MRFLKRNYGLLMVLILSFWAIKPFFVSGFFPMHDDTQVARVFEMGRVLKAGIFPARVVPDLGYGFGYPIFNFYAPLAYYVGGVFMLLGLDALAATKTMMALGIVLAGASMYFLARKLFGELGGVVAGLFYLYAPYHAVDIYVRGDVAEFWAYAFIPLAFLGIYKRNILLGALGFAAIILSHNLTAMMVTPFFFAAIMIRYYIDFRKGKSLILNPLSLILVLGLAVSAFYWIPALLEMNQTNVLSQIGGGADFRDHFVCLSQFWSSQWGFGGSTEGCIDGMSFMLGKIHILSVAALILTLIFLKIKQKNFKIYNLTIFSIAGFFISIFLMLEISRSIWEIIPAMDFFQYPWRFLILSTFFSSFLAGSLVAFFRQIGVKSYLSALMLIAAILFFNQKFFVPQTILPKTAADYTNDYALKWIASKTSDEYLAPNFKKPNNPNDVFRGQVNLRVQETPVEKVSNWISFVGFLALIVGIILMKRKARYE